VSATLFMPTLAPASSSGVYAGSQQVTSPGTGGVHLTAAQRDALLRALASDPVSWIEMYFYVPDPRDPVTGELLPPGPMRLLAHQKRVLREALRRENGQFVYTTVVYSAVKKSGKTRLAAAIAAWFAATRDPFNEIYCMANDGKQATDRVLNAIKQCVQLNSALGWTATHARVLLPNGTFIEAIPCDPKGQAGTNPGLTVWSELWGYRYQYKQRLWTEMTIPPTRFGRALRWVESYAGYAGESPILEDLYRLGVEEGERHPAFPDLPVYVNHAARLFCYWDEEPRMPWQTDDYYEQEARLLSPTEFERVHRNRWVSSEEAFIPIEWWDALAEQLPSPKRGERVVVGVDAAVSGDCFAIVVVAKHPRDKDRYAVRAVHVWKPTHGRKLSFEQPIATLRALAKQYRVVEVAYDEYQLHHLATELMRERVVYCRPFGQSVERLAADAMLYQFIRDGRIAHSGEPELREHLLNAAAKQTGSGMRIVKKSRGQHVDAAVALSMALARATYYRL
jgi:phage terminase large subunit-like protein